MLIIHTKYPKNYFTALSVMIGYIIGVGMFGLPFLVAKAGILSFLFFLVAIGLIQYFLHLVYANLIIATDGYHQLTGYAGRFLGRRWKYFAFFANQVGSFGAVLAYIIISGIFLRELLGPLFGGSEFAYSTGLFVFCAVTVWFGAHALAKSEMFMTMVLLAVVALIATLGLPAAHEGNLPLVDWRHFLLPYGAMLLALDGAGSLPFIVKLLRRDAAAVKSVVRWGTLVPVLVTFVFVVVVVAVTGKATTPDALVGLNAVLDGKATQFALIFGILTMATSYLMVTEAVKETLAWDLKMNKYAAYLLAVLAPYLCFLLGLRDLTRVVSFAGGVAGGLAASVLVLILIRTMRDPKRLVLLKSWPKARYLYVLIGLFGLGVVYEVYAFLYL